MTNEQARELGRRWLAAGGPMLEAMMWAARDALTGEECEGRYPESGLLNSEVYREPWPDFRDGATKGAALEWLREQWDEPAMAPSYWDGQPDGCDGWDLTAGERPILGVNLDTEAELYPLAAEALVKT